MITLQDYLSMCVETCPHLHSSCKVRFPALSIGRHRLLMVRRNQGQTLASQVLFEKLSVRQIKRQVHKDLRLACPFRAEVLVLRNQPGYFFGEILFVDKMIDESYHKCFFTVDIVA